MGYTVYITQGRGRGRIGRSRSSRKECELKENIRRILVPVDFSSTSNKAFLFAREMVDCWEGELHLVHVLDTDFLSGAVHIVIEPKVTISRHRQTGIRSRTLRAWGSIF